MFNLSHLYRLQLKARRINRAKQGKRKERLFCRLTNRYSVHSNYETSRLASFLMYDGQIMWETIILSDPTIFASEYLFQFVHCAHISFQNSRIPSE